MEEMDADEYLMKKAPDEEGPEIRGGTVDALIIQATKATRNGGKDFFLIVIFLRHILNFSKR